MKSYAEVQLPAKSERVNIHCALLVSWLSSKQTQGAL